MTTDPHGEVLRAGRDASAAHPSLRSAGPDAVRAALTGMGRRLTDRSDAVLEANRADLDAAEGVLAPALIDRLRLDATRLARMAAQIEALSRLDDPDPLVGTRALPDGLVMEERRRPVGVIGANYEARPNVTIDAAALCLKSGNAAVLRGSSSAAASNAVLAGIFSEAIEAAGLPAGSLELVAGGGREELGDLARQSEYIDLIIPRGGEGLKNALKEVAEVPVLYAAGGNCHVYVHADADPEMARPIVMNAKVQRPGVCNAMETLLVDAACAPVMIPRLAGALRAAGVTLRGDGRARALAEMEPATEADWDEEYLALVCAVAVVDGLDGAL
ncbi:MAG TPA: glutamate-5-semialdehyde dehydrogenase, partial [Gemmatimonadales bacterium]|nr:glutamate-5-semialdehyde dehydrogenase [Gemmatimonadales bacterium]